MENLALVSLLVIAQIFISPVIEVSQNIHRPTSIHLVQPRALGLSFLILGAEQLPFVQKGQKR